MALLERVPDEPSDEELARLLFRVLAAVIVLLLAGGVASAANRLGGEDGGAPTSENPAVGLAGPDSIGPLPGTPVAPYLADRGNALAEARERHAAVVSFTAYLSAAEVRRLLADIHPQRLLVAVPGGRPTEAAPDVDLAALAAAQREEAVREKAALEQLLPTVEDPDFARQYQADIARLNALLARKVAVGGPIPRVVFAAVVVESADRLRQLSRQGQIRIVDIGPRASLPEAGAAAGLRPDETVRVGEPGTRPV